MVHRSLIACHPLLRVNLLDNDTEAVLVDAFLAREHASGSPLGRAISWLNETIAGFRYQWEHRIPERGYAFMVYFAVFERDEDAALFALFHGDLIAEANRMCARLGDDHPINWLMKGLP